MCYSKNVIFVLFDYGASIAKIGLCGEGFPPSFALRFWNHHEICTLGSLNDVFNYPANEARKLLPTVVFLRGLRAPSPPVALITSHIFSPFP